MSELSDRMDVQAWPWLLEEAAPAVRHLALRRLKGLPVDYVS